MTTSSSPTHGAYLMAKGQIPKLMDFFKKTTVTEEELQTFHNRGWLTGNVISTIPEVAVLTIHGLTVLYFESHLLAGLGLPPSKFLAAIMNYLGYSLVHFNNNALAALSSFMMLCMLAGDSAGLQSVLVLLFPITVCQIHLWQDRTISKL
jgi:hypothetical protein